MKKIEYRDHIVNEFLSQLEGQDFTDEQIKALKQSLGAVLPADAPATAKDIEQLSSTLSGFMKKTEERFEKQSQAISKQSETARADSAKSHKEIHDLSSSLKKFSGRIETLEKTSSSSMDSLHKKLDGEAERRVAVEKELGRQINAQEDVAKLVEEQGKSLGAVSEKLGQMEDVTNTIASNQESFAETQAVLAEELEKRNEELVSYIAEQLPEIVSSMNEQVITLRKAGKAFMQLENRLEEKVKAATESLDGSVADALKSIDKTREKVDSASTPMLQVLSELSTVSAELNSGKEALVTEAVKTIRGTKANIEQSSKSISDAARNGIEQLITESADQNKALSQSAQDAVSDAYKKLNEGLRLHNESNSSVQGLVGDVAKLVANLDPASLTNKLDRLNDISTSVQSLKSELELIQEARNGDDNAILKLTEAVEKLAGIRTQGGEE